MKLNQVLGLLEQGKTVTVVELRAVEAGKFAADPAKNRGESHFLKYKVLIGDDSAEVTLYSPKGATAPPAALKFNKGQRAVMVGSFERTDYGIRGRAESLELLD